MAAQRWWAFLALVFLVGILLKVYPLAAFAVMLVAISLLARWWNNRALDQVDFRRKLYYRRGFPGEKISLQVEVENRKFLPISWLRIQDPMPYAIGPEDETLLRPTHLVDQGVLVSLFSLRWFERDRRAYNLLLRKRGIYRLGPALLESGDVYGLFERSDANGPVDYLTVFPEPLPFEGLRLPANDPFGDRRVRRRLYEDPNMPMGVREYMPEDDFRHVHWPATAHTGDLQVKVYQPISAQVMVVCLNVLTLPHYWEGTNPELLEHLIRATAAIVTQGIQDGYRVGLVSNGCLIHSDQPFRVPPGRSPNQLANLLTVLAGASPIVTSTFERFLMTEVPGLPYGASLLVVTGIMNQVLAETLLNLKRHGRRITLLSFDSKLPPTLPGIRVIHNPFITDRRYAEGYE